MVSTDSLADIPDPPKSGVTLITFKFGVPEVIGRTLMYLQQQVISRARGKICFQEPNGSFVMWLKIEPQDYEACAFLTGVEEVWIYTTGRSGKGDS